MFSKFSFRCVLAVASYRGGAIMDSTMISINNTYRVAKHSAEEIEQSTDDELNKIARMAGIGKFLLEMLATDLSEVQS